MRQNTSRPDATNGSRPAYPVTGRIEVADQSLWFTGCLTVNSVEPSSATSSRAVRSRDQLLRDVMTARPRI